MAKLREFGLEQRVVARIVHEAKVIFKFGIETNRKNVFLERNRLGIHEITAGERTDAANGFNQLGPQPGQIGGDRRRFGQACTDALGTGSAQPVDGFARLSVRGRSRMPALRRRCAAAQAGRLRHFGRRAIG